MLTVTDIARPSNNRNREGKEPTADSVPLKDHPEVLDTTVVALLKPLISCAAPVACNKPSQNSDSKIIGKDDRQLARTLHVWRVA
jgi:hypothetical protein